MPHAIGFWIVLFLGCILELAWSQGPGFPRTIQVDRNWLVSPNSPIGTIVTRAHQDTNVIGQPIIYGLKSNVRIPFKMDPRTGVVTVNDTLKDKENNTYYIWVTSFDGTAPQVKMEVEALISDTPRKPKPPFQGFPGFDSGPPFNPPKFPSFQNNPPFPIHRVTKFNPDYFELATTEPSLPVTSPPETIPLETAPSETTTITAVLDINKDKSNNTKVDVNDEPVTKNITDHATTEDKDDVSVIIIPLSAISGLVIIVGVVIAFIWKRNIAQKAKSKKDDMTKDSSGIVLQDASLHGWEGPRAYSNRYESWDNNHLQMNEETSTDTKDESRDEWEFPRHRLRIFNIVGEGAFGQVWRAQATDIDGKKGPQTVAVKTLKENASEKEKTDLIQELSVMKSLGTHPNVVRLVGCCTDKEPTLVIMEFVSLGKLQSFLRDSRAERHYGNTHGGSNSLTSRDLTHYAYQVARGMDFLSSKGIIHRDLAARNVLITEDKMCKVADFGFARDVAGTHVYERKSDGRLPIRWMAPESLYDDIFSVKSDIWSFGVLVWEIVTLGSTPYPGLSAGDVMRKVREGHRLEKPEHCRRELYNIMYYCWEAEPSGRPDFAECVSLLERLLCTETDYIELERFPDHSYYNVQNLDGEKL